MAARERKLAAFELQKRLSRYVYLISIVVSTTLVSIIDILHNPHLTRKYIFSFSLLVRLGLRRWNLPDDCAQNKRRCRYRPGLEPELELGPTRPALLRSPYIVGQLKPSSLVC